jgi:hypothetical protein
VRTLVSIVVDSVAIMSGGGFVMLEVPLPVMRRLLSSTWVRPSM